MANKKISILKQRFTRQKSDLLLSGNDAIVLASTLNNRPGVHKGYDYSRSINPTRSF